VKSVLQHERSEGRMTDFSGYRAENDTFSENNGELGKSTSIERGFGKRRGNSEWKTCCFSDSFVKNNVGRHNQIPAKNIALVGRFPVVDQGQEFISGYCDDENKVIDFNLPLIIFGDHTRCFKYVDFPFVLGADGTKVIAPNKKIYDPKFYYFALLALELPSRGYNRHFKSLKAKCLPLPPLPEQQKIASILSMVQRAIEAQERIIQTTTELKKALMHKFFTEGLRNEPQKETEIGLLPESWDVVELGEMLSTAQYGLSVKGNSEGNHPIIRMTNQVDGQIIDHNLQYVEIGESDFEKFKVQRGDILFNRTNSFDLVGRTAIFNIAGDFVFASYLIRLRTDKTQLDPYFLNSYFNADEIQARLKSIATRAISQSNISATRLKGFLVPKPCLVQQKEIVSHSMIIDSKLAVYRLKLAQLQDLFRTLLQELMSANFRVV
jgi:type I restriction enzyme, S subunit